MGFSVRILSLLSCVALGFAVMPAHAQEFVTNPQTLEITEVPSGSTGSTGGGAGGATGGGATGSTGSTGGGLSQNVQDAIDLENQLQGLGGLGSIGSITSSLGAQPYPGTAAAITCYFCQCQADLSIYHRMTRRTINRHIDKAFDSLRKNYILGEFVDEIVRPDIQKKTQQTNLSDQREVETTAAIEDAAQANEKALDAGEDQVEIARRNVTSPLIGTIATFVRGLGESSVKLQQSKLGSGDLNMEKILAKSGTLGAKGAGTLEEWRTKQMLEVYVDDKQQAGLLKGQAKGKARADRDVDIARTLLGRKTLNVDFSDSTLTDDEADLLALKENLMPSSTLSLSTMRDLTSPDAMNKDIPELLTSAARKSIIESSLNTIIGQRAEGSDVSKDQLKALLVDQLGYPEDSDLVKEMTGKTSYEGHMEALTRFAFQNPAVYVDLIGQPEMIQRAIVTQNAIRNMQQYDIYASSERSENLHALWAWMETRGMHTAAQNELSAGTR